MTDKAIRRIGCAVLIDAHGRLLLQQRDDVPGILQPGKIGLFGGHCEDGESGLDCAVREIEEETSFAFARERFVPLRVYEGADPDRADGQLQASIFTLKLDNEPLVITEGSLFVAELSRAAEFRAKLTPTAAIAIAAYLARY